MNEPTLSDLSATDRTFLAAMAEDEVYSVPGDIQRRMKIEPSCFSAYRQRLIDAGVVYSPERGKLDYSLPYLRDCLRTHPVTEAMSSIAQARRDFPAPPTLP